ncbi:MAG: hypothetical protein NZ521_09965, partial [Flammeovirgaceae bacterium]|nr:hypothetical protein [Flammeovirgaceae bacterium]MDW8288558.1 hypothetical protein [Flammeovirgaceae bacterium]
PEKKDNPETTTLSPSKTTEAPQTEIEQSPEIKASLEALEEALRNFRQEDYMPKKKQPNPQKEETFGFSEAEIQRLKRMTEDELWVWAQTKNSIEAYRAYIEYSREASHVADAYFFINQLMHQNEMEPVSMPFSSTYPSYESPSAFTEVVGDITTTSVSSEEEELWKKAQTENTIGAYFNYMNATVEKKYWDEAKRRINELKGGSSSQEQIDWENAQKEDTIEAYRNYIRKYPLGNHYAKAMFRINKLEADLNN